ncbi:T9SS type A sorting domain-containing protein, partial [bacterium]|nr:T9SS type A sorting domain-containing protein [bacterium]
SYQSSFELVSGSFDEATVKIVGQDINGNTSSRLIRFPLIKATPNQSSTLQSKSMVVNIPKNAMSAPRSIALLPPSEFAANIQADNELIKVQGLGLLTPTNLEFLVPSYGKIMINRPLEKQEALFVQNSSSRVFVPVTYLDGELLFKVDHGGNFAIYKDQKAPEIHLESEDEGEDLLLSGFNPKFVFSLQDLGTGIDDVQVKVGVKSMQIVALDVNTYEASYSGHLPRGQHSVSIISRDKVGNQSILKAMASVSGPIRLSAQIYPNPVREMLNVRYTLSRSARNLSFKIYDMAGDRVYSSSLKTDMNITAVAGINEFQWDLENSRGLEVANGVYILQIDTEDSQGYRDRVRIKIAVLR